jgi:hypothetical protein
MLKARKVEGAIVMEINARLMWFSMVKRDMTLTLSVSASVYVASVGYEDCSYAGLLNKGLTDCDRG